MACITEPEGGSMFLDLLRGLGYWMELRLRMTTTAMSRVEMSEICRSTEQQRRCAV